MSREKGAVHKFWALALIPISAMTTSPPIMPKLSLLACLLALSLAGQNPAPTNPVATKDAPPYTRKSIAQGKQLYLIHCAECHDQDGKGLGRRDFSGTPPADLTDPDGWLHGTSAAEIFLCIREGTKEDMPQFKGKLRDEQLWHIVNFVRSLWPEAKRPKLEADPDSGKKGASWKNAEKDHAGIF
jgi:mono/diheme cytochrome c family protein